MIFLLKITSLNQTLTRFSEWYINLNKSGFELTLSEIAESLHT